MSKSSKGKPPFGGTTSAADAVSLRYADDESLRIADRLLGTKKQQYDEMFGYVAPVKPKVTLPEISIQKKPHIEPLLQHKQDRREQAIETMLRNRPRLDEIIAKLDRGEYPGVVGYSYVPGTYCLTLRYVALSVQWYAHRDMCYVQEGNAKKRNFILDIGTLIHKLEGGRKNFQ